MKIIKQLLFVVFALILLSSNCKKDNQAPQTELAKLPPITQIGANTFGCLINGQAFVPGSNIFLASHKQCNYIFSGGGYYFTILVYNTDNTGLVTQVSIQTDSLLIAQGQTLLLKDYTKGNANASYAMITNANGINRYDTNNSVTGQLTITKLDPVKQIVSGTFYFNAVNAAGVMVTVTDGRFDMPYTQ